MMSKAGVLWYSLVTSTWPCKQGVVSAQQGVMLGCNTTAGSSRCS